MFKYKILSICTSKVLSKTAHLIKRLGCIVVSIHLAYCPLAQAQEPLQTLKLSDLDKTDEQYFIQIANKWTAATYSQSPAVLKAKVSTEAGGNYILGVGDVLSFKILQVTWNNQEASFDAKPQDIIIHSNGEATFEPFGTFKIGGMKLIILQKMLEEMASYYIVNPKLYLSVKTARPYSIYVSGSVKRPGSYQVTENAYSLTHTNESPDYNPNNGDSAINTSFFIPKVTKVIAAAGGISRNADIENIRIYNQYSGRDIKINLLSFLRGDVSQDIFLEPEDSIFIPTTENGVAMSAEVASSTFASNRFPVRIMGYTSKIEGQEGSEVYLDSDNMSVLQAISKTNLDPKADLKKVVILRRNTKEHKIQHYIVNALEEDFPLKPYDIIYLQQMKTSWKIQSIVQIVSPIMWSGIGVGGLIKN